MIDIINSVKKFDFDSRFNSNPVLLDSCFIFYLIHNEHQQKEFFKNEFYLTTSFNIYEMLYHHKIEKHLLKDFLKKNNVGVLMLDVNPGDNVSERYFVNSIDPFLLKIVKDPSDAVLVASALKIKADVISRDKHHVFNPAVFDYLASKNLKIRHK